MQNNGIKIYTDGAARGNPGRGGYGALLIWGNVKKELSQGYIHTTNNRMELMAVIAALEALKKENLQIDIYSDSKYVVQAVTEGWLKNIGDRNIKTAEDALNYINKTDIEQANSSDCERASEPSGRIPPTEADSQSPRWYFDSIPRLIIGGIFQGDAGDPALHLPLK